MTPTTIEQVVASLATLIEPKLKWSILTLNLIKEIRLEGDQLFLTIHLISQDAAAVALFREQCLEVLQPFGFDHIQLNLQNVLISQEGVSGVKNIILVGSGKGGVGKSTVAVNLACALQAIGCSVGLMDADIYGPSVPQMLGLNQKPETMSDEYLLPVNIKGLKVMSLGLLFPQGKSVSWRGQLVSGTILQFLQKTYWDTLDFLVIDLPPGTGDVQLTLAQKIKAQGVVLVMTPQEVVLGDVRRAYDLYQNSKVPVLALVQNMSGMLCERCGHENHPFNVSDSPIKLAGVPLFELPLQREISQTGDAGTPIVQAYADHPVSKIFKNIALHLTLVTDNAEINSRAN